MILISVCHPICVAGQADKGLATQLQLMSFAYKRPNICWESLSPFAHIIALDPVMQQTALTLCGIHSKLTLVSSMKSKAKARFSRLKMHLTSSTIQHQGFIINLNQVFGTHTRTKKNLVHKNWQNEKERNKSINQRVGSEEFQTPRVPLAVSTANLPDLANCSLLKKTAASVPSLPAPS